MAEQTGGLMSIEDIIRTDTRRKGKSKTYSTDVAFQAFNYFAKKEGVQMARLRNTIIILIPTEKRDELEVHLFSADPVELYLGLLLRFALALVEKRGTKKLVTYAKNAEELNRFKELAGPEFTKVTKEKGRYKFVFDIDGAYKKYSQGVS